MHNHDHDIIFSVANRELEGSDLADATAEIAACGECSMELELQRSGASLLAAVTPPSLGIDERNALRASVQEKLGLVTPAPVVAAQPQRKRFRNWAPIAVAALALTGVVFVAPQLGLLGGNDESASFDATAAATIPSQVEGESAPSTVQSLTLADDAGEVKEETSTTANASEPPAESIASATAEGIDGSTMYFMEELSFVDLQALLDQEGDASLERSAVPLADECANSGRDEFTAETATPLAFGSYEDVDAIAIVYEVADRDDAIIAIHDAETCEVLASTR